jgi:hypothetical protein
MSIAARADARIDFASMPNGRIGGTGSCGSSQAERGTEQPGEYTAQPDSHVNLEFGSIQVDTLSSAGKQRMLRRDVRISVDKLHLDRSNSAERHV